MGLLEFGGYSPKRNSTKSDSIHVKNNDTFVIVFAIYIVRTFVYQFYNMYKVRWCKSIKEGFLIHISLW